MKILAIYDNPAFADRYTVYYTGGFYPGNSTTKMYDCLGMSAHPFSPQGIGQHSSGQLGSHNGKKISFSKLPLDCQRAVKQDLQDN